VQRVAPDAVRRAITIIAYDVGLNERRVRGTLAAVKRSGADLTARPGTKE
jgi:hypothetical protein